ncbi:phytoene synthase [Prauserella marina]|uniref:Phytoene synthase n=1 Tax=Prauserella marina TaxID=530584 RepID=A0A222VUE8_9PSEU|nr:phytoene/squalene synthase family protein [Prauserella marina]ASR37534.1 phytoene synthase [Prauserella marina]PWV75429.1 phytoene synthase [Prauserella marina]SDD34750.1 phytoene synthase [Prauserella marina]
MELATAYATCRRINARHGRTFFLATRLLPARARPAAHALYGFARSVDELVDNPRDGSDPAAMLDACSRALDRVYARGKPLTDPVLLAFADTVGRYGLERELFDAFLHSMKLDLSVREYATFTELAEYTHGSAEVIGLQMLPVLGTVVPHHEAAPYAAALGEAFQLTNFLRDVGEDLERGRLYLPTEELAAYGVERQRLEWAWHTGGTDRGITRALAALVARNRAVYRRAKPGIPLLRKESRSCVRTALTLYEGILDEIVAADYNVLGGRVAVPRRRRFTVAGTAILTRLWT